MNLQIYQFTLHAVYRPLKFTAMNLFCLGNDFLRKVYFIHFYFLYCSNSMFRNKYKVYKIKKKEKINFKIIFTIKLSLSLFFYITWHVCVVFFFLLNLCILLNCFYITRRKLTCYVFFLVLHDNFNIRHYHYANSYCTFKKFWIKM